MLFSLYINDMPVPPNHVDLTLYAHDTAIIAESRKTALFISYLESQLSDIERWLGDWTIAINIRRDMRCSSLTLVGVSPSPDQHSSSGSQFIESIQPVSGVTVDTRVTWSPHMDQV